MCFLSFTHSSAALFLFFEALLRVSRLVIIIRSWAGIARPPWLRVSTMTIMISLLSFRWLPMHDSLYTFHRTWCVVYVNVRYFEVEISSIPRLLVHWSLGGGLLVDRASTGLQQQNKS
jgi:hypothetical protein